MATTMSTPQSFNSPKRKRGGLSSSDSSPQLSKVSPAISTSFDPLELPVEGTASPRTLVARHLKDLDLTCSWIGELPVKDAGRARKRFAQMSPEPEGQHVERPLQVSIEVPHIDKPEDTSVRPTDLQTSETPSETLDNIQASMIMSRPRARSRSPPLDGDPDDNPLTWHASEITGYTPDDPNDDGYGLNGIGFRPTAATAWSRSQKRQQQIVEYRNREAREARQRRSERRRLSGLEQTGSASGSSGGRSKVRFEEPNVDQS